MNIETPHAAAIISNQPASALQKTELNLLPCRVEDRVDVDVDLDKYFVVRDEAHPRIHTQGPPESIDEEMKKLSNRTKETMCTTFRGRELHGARVCVPENYEGVVFSSNDDDDEIESSAKSMKMKWTPEQSFTEFTYWNHDEAPSDADILKRSLDWLKVAPALHEHVKNE